MKLYNSVYGTLVEPTSISELEDLMRKLEENERPLACSVEVDGGTGSTLLNIMLPDFTEEEELALLRILKTASERTVKECEDGIKLCNRQLAHLQGLKVIECRKSEEDCKR